MTDLFDAVVPEARLNERFTRIAEARGYAPARATMRETFARMGPRDPNFVEQFQTTGFDARFSELYIFAALDASGFDVTSVGAAPDFLVRGHEHAWAVEVTTANPPNGAPPPTLPEHPLDLLRYTEGELAIRLGSALFSKLNRRYWEFPHVAGNPLVLAVQNFASEQSLQLADTALAHYLYGFRTYSERADDGRLHVYTADFDTVEGEGGKTIPSRFFATPDAEHISAVLWTNSGTVAKFARMGFQRGLCSQGIRMERVGLRYVPDADADLPAPFRYAVGDRWETWTEGLVMAHNPYALIPLPEEAFPGIVHLSITAAGEFRAIYPPFHAFRSQTVIAVETPANDGHDDRGGAEASPQGRQQ